MHDFESIRVGYYENVACAIIVYDISKKTSLNKNIGLKNVTNIVKIINL